MPISIDRFEESEELRERTTSERVVQFLLAHDEQAFTRGELADALDVAPNTVGTNLSRLKERELVRHREPYWAITDDHERVASAFKTRAEDAYLNELLGEEEWDEWEGHAASDDALEHAREESNNG
jgi:Mn-dependent DtxR family transcriptional regulator